MAAPARTPSSALPSDFDGVVAEFDRFSHRLVLLDEIPLPAVLAELRRFAAALADHLGNPSDAPRPSGPHPAGSPVRSDHVRFRLSLEELSWFDAILSRDDHGGNRQAFGQYGKILAEALRRHRDLERGAPSAGPGPPPLAEAVASKQP